MPYLPNREAANGCEVVMEVNIGSSVENGGKSRSAERVAWLERDGTRVKSEEHRRSEPAPKERQLKPFAIITE